jgi:hypothetical protein
MANRDDLLRHEKHTGSAHGGGCSRPRRTAENTIPEVAGLYGKGRGGPLQKGLRGTGHARPLNVRSHSGMLTPARAPEGTFTNATARRLCELALRYADEGRVRKFNGGYFNNRNS